jgi:hypothetical protein
MIEGGARGVVSKGDAFVEEVFDMISGEDGSEVDSLRFLFS